MECLIYWNSERIESAIIFCCDALKVWFIAISWHSTASTFFEKEFCLAENSCIKMKLWCLYVNLLRCVTGRKISSKTRNERKIPHSCNLTDENSESPLIGSQTLNHHILLSVFHFYRSQIVPKPYKIICKKKSFAIDGAEKSVWKTFLFS